MRLKHFILFVLFIVLFVYVVHHTHLREYKVKGTCVNKVCIPEYNSTKYVVLFKMEDGTGKDYTSNEPDQYVYFEIGTTYYFTEQEWLWK